MNKQSRLRIGALSAMFAALIIVTTAYIKIPAPLGYVHIGDSMVYLAAAILPFPFNFLAVAVGGATADLLAGYPQWALPTAIIKALNALPFFLIRFTLKSSPKLNKIINLQNLLMLIPTTIITLGGYFAANALMYDVGAAVAELLPNLFQAFIGGVVFVAAGLSLDAVKFKSKILHRERAIAERRLYASCELCGVAFRFSVGLLSRPRIDSASILPQKADRFLIEPVGFSLSALFFPDVRQVKAHVEQHFDLFIVDAAVQGNGDPLVLAHVIGGEKTGSASQRADQQGFAFQIDDIYHTAAL